MLDFSKGLGFGVWVRSSEHEGPGTQTEAEHQLVLDAGPQVFEAKICLARNCLASVADKDNGLSIGRGKDTEGREEGGKEGT